MNLLWTMLFMLAYGGGGGSSSSESNSALSSLYHFPSKPMIHPACRRREKCSLLACSLGLNSAFFWQLELDFLHEDFAGWSFFRGFVRSWVSFAGVPFSECNKVFFDSVPFKLVVLVSFILSSTGFLDWKKGMFGLLSSSGSCLKPRRASSFFCWVIFSNGAASSLGSAVMVSMYFMCSLFCRNSASSLSFSSLTLASGS